MSISTKRFTLFAVFTFIIFVVIIFINETTIWPFGALASVQRQIDSHADKVLLTGQDHKVTFIIPNGNGMLILSPPYSNILGLRNYGLSTPLLKTVQKYVNTHETGHIFYIENGRLIDHRLLSGIAEPILGVETKKEVVFLLSRKSTSGRPIRIELLRN